MVAQPTTTETTTTETKKGYAYRQPDEPALVALAQRGDERAFEVLHGRYRTPIWNHLYRCSEDPVVAEDLTQDVFLKAWLHLPRTLEQGELTWGAWLYRIATNVWRDRYRHEKLLQWEAWDAFLAMPHPAQVAPDRPEREALDAETRREVRAVLDSLAADIPDDYRHLAVKGRGARYRMVLELHYLGDLSYEAIAAATGTTRASVKTVLHRARRAFRERWEARHAGAGAGAEGVVA